MQPHDFKRKYRGSGASYIKQPNGWHGRLLRIARGFPKGHVFAVAGLSASLVLFVATPSKTEANNRKVIDDLAIPALETLPEPTNVASEELNAELYELESRLQQKEPTRIKVQSGDNLSLVFQRAGLNDRDVYEILNSDKEAKRLKQLYPGNIFEFTIENDELTKLNYIAGKLSSYSLTKTEDGYEFNETSRKPDIHLTTRSATINQSLFAAGKEAHLDDKLVMQLAGIFGWDVDFALDIREGDSFRVLFEEQFLDGEKLGNGDILAAEFINKGRTYQAVRYEDSDGRVQYYTPEGRTMRKAFLRTPIDFARISSHFNLRRKHPVLNKIRAHKGTDYAASHGTPIKAAGDGKVVFAGRKGGYGNVVIIQHGQTYKTLYAHISKFRKGIRSGKRVKQGQTIAYVGSTGLATGPHLHYEFYVNGAVRNPVTVKLPNARPIAKSELARFTANIQPLIAQLNTQDSNTKLASAEDNDSNNL